jgi:hypothetical protein
MAKQKRTITGNPVYLLPSDKQHVMALALSHALNGAYKAYPKTYKGEDRLGLAATQCDICTNAKVPRGCTRITNDISAFRDIFVKTYLIGYDFAVQALPTGLYTWLLGKPEQERKETFYKFVEEVLIPQFPAGWVNNPKPFKFMFSDLPLHD